MSKRTKKAEEPTEQQAQCAHQWLIESPQGPTSLGICSKCGERKKFVNYFASNRRSFNAMWSPNRNPQRKNAKKKHKKRKKKR